MMFSIEYSPIIDQHALSLPAISPYQQRPLLPIQQWVAMVDKDLRVSSVSNTDVSLSCQNMASPSFRKNSFADTLAFKNEQAKQTRAISVLADGWKHFLLDPAAPVDVDAISETVDFIFEAITQFGPGAIDLTRLSAERVNGEHLAAILRVTSSWKSRIPGWAAALMVAKESLVLAGSDPSDALIGLR